MKKIITFFAAISLLCFLSKISYAQCLNSETEFKDYFDKNISTLDPIEGIWNISQIVTSNYMGNVETKKFENYKTNYIIKIGDNFYLCDIKSTVITIFSKTSIDGIYLYKQYKNLPIMDANKTYSGSVTLTGGTLISYSKTLNKEDVAATFADNNFLITKEQYDGMVANTIITIDYTFIKTYPNKQSVEKSQKSSGTGFAISSTGYIATCNHVINGATSLKIKGVDGDFIKSYTAKVINTDVNNDLAIIKIDDVSFSTLGIIPYTISSTSKDVGSNVFILGYPLRATMGDEIKLTDGIISAKSGFKGDITSYQISAAAQPGNSGGPLFDKNGNVIGVVNAKHVLAENATYAVKSTYLKNFIDALPIIISLPTVNSLTGKALIDQVKAIKNFVYIIEVN